MTRKLTTAVVLTGLMIASHTTFAASPPKMKMTTDILANVITPDKVETSIGTLNFVDGVPTKETAQ
jgi:hypothetical protein